MEIARRRGAGPLRVPLLAALVISTACASGSQPADSPPPPGDGGGLALRECTVPGVLRPVRCGTLDVPEDRNAPSGRRIGLRVVVVPARGADPAADPLFVLAGGPGQGAASLAGTFASLFEAVNERRALVLVDQRGTGASNPLACPDAAATVENLLSAQGAEGVRRCLAALEGRADVRFYTTAHAVEDLEAVRAALGYARVNLFGGSYGTRVAQAYLRRYPERVRAAVLRAVVPVGGNVPVLASRAADDAMALVLAQCAAEAGCAAAFPALEADLDSLLARVARDPPLLRLPGGGREVRLSHGLLVQLLYALLLSDQSRPAVPALLHAAATRGPGVLAPVAAQVLPLYHDLPLGMYLSVVCAEDAPRITPADVDGAGRRRFGVLVTGLRDACGAWPRGAVPDPFHAPAPIGVPTLLLSGEADPGTPPAGGEAALRYLTDGRHLVLPGAAHIPSFPGCAARLVAEFLDAGTHAGLDASCLQALRRPPFMVPGGTP